MDSFLKMDVFFVVTTIVVIILGVLVALILWLLFRIMGHVEHLSEQVDEEAEFIRTDIADMRREVRSGMRWSAVAAFGKKLYKRFGSEKRSTTSKR